MQIKFKKSIFNYRYLIVFDLASRTSGYAVFDLERQYPIEHGLLEVKESCELKSAELASKITEFFNDFFCRHPGVSRGELVITKEAMPTQLHGGGSTIKTFLSLAKSHAVLDNYCYANGIDVYDYNGVAPISTHAYLKRLTGIEKIEKEDIAHYVEERYKIGVDDIQKLDETDAIFIGTTLLERKWDMDLREEVMECKRHMNTMKSKSGVRDCYKQYLTLQSLYINQQEYCKDLDIEKIITKQIEKKGVK